MAIETAQLAEVIERARSRDPGAFDLLVDTYGSRMFGYFFRLTGSRDDADDLLQELFIRVVRTIPTYRHEHHFDAWLFRIATNLVRDRLRRIRAGRNAGLDHRGTGDSDDGDPLEEHPDLAAAAPQDAMLRAEQVDRLQLAIDRLPGQEREVICLRHFSGLSFREIAETMGTPLGTALARAHRGLARLRELMGNDTLD